MSLEITVSNALNLPNLETLGKVDPFCRIVFKGLTKKTEVVKAETNPVWNQTLQFDLAGLKVQEKDEIDIQIKDWERLGGNRLLGSVKLTMRDVFKASPAGNPGKLSLDLVDANQRPLGATLVLTVLYKAPAGSEPATSGGRVVQSYDPMGEPDINTNDEGAGDGDAGGGDVGADQGVAGGGTSGGQRSVRRRTGQGGAQQRTRADLPTKPQDFQLRIKILKARQLSGSNVSPVCRVRCGGLTKQTRIQKSTNSPHWGEIFFFNFHKGAAELFEQIISFEVFNSQRLRSDAMIGAFKCDLSMIYDEADHSMLNKWLLLSDPEDGMSGTKGYLKICATLLGPGDMAPSFTTTKTEDDDDIEANLLRPAGVPLRPATFKLKVYRAEDLPRMDSSILQGVKEIFGSDEKKEFVDPYFVFNFAGREVKTKIIYNCDHPEWNQELRLGLQFPSMCEKLKFQMLDWDRVSADDSIGLYNLYTWSMSRLGGDATSEDAGNGAEGFLPTIGPCFVNFYGSPREFSEIPTDYDDLNIGKGEGVAYRGRALIELQTVLGELPPTPLEEILPDDVLRVQKYMRRRRYKLHTTFLNASMISEIDCPIEFEVSIGNYGNKLDENMPACISTSQPTNPVFDGCNYYFLPWGDIKPCVAIDCHWEDISFRLEAVNLLLLITERLEKNVSNLEMAQKANVPLPEQAESLVRLLSTLIEDCKKPLPPVVEGVHMENDLDRNLRLYRMTELSKIIEDATKLRDDATEIDQALKEIEVYVNTLKNITIEPQNSMPDVLIWMLSGEKRLAYHRCPAHLVLWSDNPDYRGKYCGKLESIFLKYPGSKAEKENRWEVPALIRVRVWLGLAAEEAVWHRMQTEGDFAVFAETYENQVSALGKWTNKSLTMSRPKWSDPTGKIELDKDKFEPPPGWKWEGDWYVSPELSMMYDKDAGHTQFLEDVYEFQTRIPGTNWGPATNGWTDVKGDAVTARDEVKLPAGWEWQDSWQVDLNRAVDEYGWEYTIEATLGGYGPVEKNYHLCRRRRWVRTRNLVSTTTISEAEKVKKEAVKTEGWEYAPLFTMKYHHVERKMDIVRRRRWLRKMIADGTTKSDEAAPPCFFQMSSHDALHDKEEVTVPITAAPRMFFVCDPPHSYQLRAYVYQGRDLAAADSNGLSDPFARVSFLNQSQATLRLDKTVCPTWDQTLLFRKVEIHGDPASILANPPEIVIEVFDYDTFGKAEFLGRTRARPHVKLNASTTDRPILQWYDLMRGKKESGELLLAFELLLMNGQELPFEPPKRGDVYMVPSGIRPVMIRTAIEVMCWGVRNMKRYQFVNVTSPSIELEVGDKIANTKIIKNTNQNPNFDDNILFFDIMMPREELYAPPLMIHCRDNRPFGRKPKVGSAVVKSLEQFRCEPLTDAHYEGLIQAAATPAKGSMGDHIVIIPEDKKSMESGMDDYEITIPRSVFDSVKNTPKAHKAKKAPPVEEDLDWWSKFYASSGEMDKCKQYCEQGYDTLQIYPMELEKVAEFNNFTDFCHTFSLTRGKDLEDEESNVGGEFKGTFRVYPLPGDPGAPLPPRILRNLPHSKPVECIVRVYVIQAMELQPNDPNGLIKLGKTRLENKDQYIANTLNPVFGRMFELKTLIPLDTELHVRVKDFDLMTSDDMIGETIIDLENRLLSKHCASVGLPLTYCSSGITQWRDSRKPSELLEAFCIKNLNCTPSIEDESIGIGSRTYRLTDFESRLPTHPHLGEASERLSLHVLKLLSNSMTVPLVPEHVETRPLYNPLQPGIEQGRIQMWVDIFPTELGPPGPPVDIKPRQAKKYELRIIIWNTKDVILDEQSITGERMSDIYVKGWMSGIDEKQETDVHYRSLDGEGNFNWRFVFPFQYIAAEECVVVKKKEHFWSLDERESRLPPVLVLQIWDNDKLSADDFLGAVELNLSNLPKPAKKSENCSLRQLSLMTAANENAPPVKMVSMFEQKKLKGYWPCYRDENGTPTLTGKIEMEIELLSEEESNLKPAGKARDEPNDHPHLDPPKRPETSFLWFTSPFKTCKLIVWRHYKWYFISAIIILFIVIFMILFIYALPGAAVQKLFHV